MGLDGTLRDLLPGEQERTRRKALIIQRAREGFSIGEQCILAGITRDTHSEWRKDDQFRMEWERARDEANIRFLERRKMAQGRRRIRAELAAIGAQAALKTVGKLYSLEGEVAPTQDMIEQAKEDPVGFVVKAIVGAKTSDDLDARAFKLDEEEKSADGDASVARGDVDAPASDLDGFLRVDLGLSGDRDYRRDVAGGVYRRAYWIVERALRPDVRRVVLCTGKGAGKTVCISLVLAREFQRLIAAQDSAHPRRGVLNLSASGGDQAEMAVFTDLRRWLAGPWFARLGAPARETTTHVEWTILNGGVVCAHSGNSRSEGVEGVDWTAAGADEVCRLPERDNARVLSADGLVGPVEDTMVSRFGATYKLLLASWPEHQGDYLLGRDEKSPGQVERARRTGIREDLTRSFLGEPLTWAGGEGEAARQRALSEPPFSEFATEVFLANDGTLVVHCPMWQVRADADLDALRTHHARDPVTFAARFGACPVVIGASPFLRDPKLIRERANPNRAHPVGPDGRFLDWFKGSPEFLYYAHVDGALGKAGGDAAGICVGHWDQGRVVVDLLLEVRGANGGEVQLEELRQVLYAMQARGFTFAAATCDGFEGFSMRQELTNHGIPSEHLSVDRTREPYEDWRDAVQTGRVDYYPYEPLFRNADSLVDAGKKVDHTATGCFSGDTRVRLLDGTTPTLAQLAAFPDDLHYVYTIKDGRVSVGAAHSPRLTRRDANTVVVTLDSGEQITCTPDHRFMLRDGTYREAGMLASGESLMPLYLDVSDQRMRGKMKGYEMYLCPYDGGWHLTHRMVGRWKYGSEYMSNGRNGKVLHHVVKKKNNDPRQLELLANIEHLRRHRDEMLARWADPEFKAKFDAARLARVKSPEFRERQRERMRLRNADPEYRAKVKSGQADYFQNGGREESRSRMVSMQADPTSAIRKMRDLKSVRSKERKKSEKVDGITRWRGRPTVKLTSEQARQRRSEVARDLHANPAYVAKLRAGHLRYRTSEEGRRKSSETLKATMARPDMLAAVTERARAMGKRTGKENITQYNKSEKHRRVASEIGKRTIKIAIEARKRHDITIERILEVAKTELTQRRAAVVLECDPCTIWKRCKRSGFKSWDNVRAAVSPANHKVISVVPGPCCDVYDLSVDETQNFALAAGVFVHNSKDVADSMAAVVHVLVKQFGGMTQLGSIA